MSALRLICLELMIAALLCMAHPPKAAAQPRVSYVGENESIGWAEWGEWKKDYTLSSAESQRWPDIYSFVIDLVNDQQIHAISRVDSALMKSYHFIPAPLPPLAIWGANDRWVIYRADLATLPAPPLVTRQLRVYIRGLRYEGMLLPQEFWITIEGERQE